MLAYLDIPSGISGDMFLGCLVDAGWPLDQLRATLAALRLPASEWSVDARQVMKGPMRATFVDVQAHEGHVHRHLADVRAIILAGDDAVIPAAVKERAGEVFARLAEAEAKVHGTTPDKIHFHEVGAVDAIIDVVGTIAGLHALGVDRLYCSAVPLGEGWAKTAHGQIPLPAPATLELLSAAGAPTRPAPGPGEWVTPTGAALLAEIAEFGQPALQLQRIGIGAGQRDCPWPNVARLWLGQAQPQGALVQLETNIDDMNPQLYASVLGELLAAGALDAWLTPVQMKKGRPGVVLSVLAPLKIADVLSDILLRQTTTLGVRMLPVTHRAEARREVRALATPLGTVGIKLKWVGQELLGATPEYDDCLHLAQQQHLPVREVWEQALAAALAYRATLTAAQPIAPTQPTAPAHPHDHGHAHGHTHNPAHPHAHEPAPKHDHGHTHDRGHDHGHTHPH